MRPRPEPSRGAQLGSARRSTTLVLASLLGAASAPGIGCVPAPRVIDVPEPGDARTVVYVARRGDEPPLLYAVDVEAGALALPELGLHPEEPLELSALHYRCSPAVLGLEPGILELAPEGEGQPLPPPDQGYVATLTSGPVSWSPLVERPLERVSRPVRCARFDYERAVVPDTNTFTSTTSFLYATFAYPVSEQEVIVAISDGRFYRVRDRTAERLELPEGTPHLAYHRQDDGTVWLYGAGGALARGTFEAGFEIVTATSAAGSARQRAWLTGEPRASEPILLYAVDETGRVERFDGESWKILYEFRGERGRRDMAFGGVVWVGDRRAQAVSVLGHRLVHLTPESAVPEDVGPASSNLALSAIARIPALGTVLGSFGGRVFIEAEEGGFTGLQSSPLLGTGGGFGLIPAVAVVGALDGGFLFGGGFGSFAEYQPGVGTDPAFCDYRETMPAVGLQLPERLTEYAVSGMIPLGCGYVVLSKQGNYDADVEVTFLTRIP